jgi:alkylated DNA repair dioxygenase AlkB
MEARFDAHFAALRRHRLDAGSWVDFAPEWLHGADGLYDEVADALPWRQHVVTMYGRRLPEPRLSCWFTLGDMAGSSKLPPVAAEMATVLGRRYGVEFDSVGCNWYRTGEDSVAWHADTRGPPVVDPTIAIVSLGSRRPFRLRPRPAGRTARSSTPRPLTLEPGAGDLLVMGGSCQREWEHSVPKSRGAGPRISITFRHSGNR